MNFTFLLLFNLYLCLWIGLFYLAFSQKTTLKINRYLLLSGILFAAILPFIGWPSSVAPMGGAQAAILPSGGTGIFLSDNPPGLSSRFPLWLLLTRIYWLGVMISGAWFGWKLIKICRLTRTFQRVPKKGYTHVITPEKWEVFSFLNFLFAPVQMPESILEHEQVHIRQKHSLDNLLLEIIKVFCWFNPAVYLYQRALKMTHEYLADASAVQLTDVSEYAQKLVSQSFRWTGLSLVHPFFKNSNLQKRLIMLQKKKQSGKKVWSYLFLIPALAGFLFLSSSFSIKNKLEHGIEKIKPTKLTGSAATGVLFDTTYTGFIFSSEGEPVTEATLLVSGLPQGTRTNEKGYFKLEAAPGKILKISSIGYNPITIRLPKNKRQLKIILYPKPGALNQLNVTGYTNKNVPPPLPPPAPVQSSEANHNPSGVLQSVDQMPQYPGGEQALMKYLKEHIRYPDNARKEGIQGTVIVQFIVSKNGALKDVKTVGTPKGGGLEEEAIRIVNNMPEWIPGKQNNKKVAVQLSLPIRFMLSGPEKGTPSQDTLPEKSDTLTPHSSKAEAADHGTVLEHADKMPSFPGGEKALMVYLHDSIKYPTDARENGLKGTVLVQFIVEKDGSLTHLKTVNQKIGGGLEEEALRVVKAMPKWIPGRQNGKTARVQYVLPIRFMLQ